MASSLMVDRPLKVACVGGGQLGRMMALEAPRLNIEMTCLDPGGIKSPAAQVLPHSQIIEGGLKDELALRKLAEGCDVLTVEIEHVGVEVLQQECRTCSTTVKTSP